MPMDRNWTVTQNKTSGVGKLISERIYNHGLYTYMVKNSLVIHGDHESVMHPGERTTNPLISNYDINTVAAGVASMPQRIKSLKDAVYSILPQVGRLYVYLNNYDTIPDFLVNDKIIVFNSADAFGDIGDVGKFYACENHKGYFFTLDDDLIYPNDYVQKYICAIERLQKKAIVTIHGRNYEPKPVKSYYKGHSQGFRCLNHQQDLELEVTVGGSGVMAWHTSTINFNLWDFKTTNMADIWAAVKAHKNNVPIILLKHSKTWLRESPNYDNSFSIYSACFRKDKVQTDMFNQYLLPELIKSKK
jgi:WD40 repeat protein